MAFNSFNTFNRCARVAVGIAALLASSACEETGSRHDGSYGTYPPKSYAVPPVMLQTDAASYPAGAVVTVRLTNRTGVRAGYNLCQSRIDQQNSEGDWRERQPTLADVCTQDLRGLAPGQSVTYSFKTDGRSRGPHRIRTALHGVQGPERVEVVSNTFILTRDSD